MGLKKFLSWVLLAFTLATVGLIGSAWLEACNAGRVAEAWAKGAFLLSFLTMAFVAAFAVSGVEIHVSGDYNDLFGDGADLPDPPPNPYRPSRTFPSGPFAGHFEDKSA